MPPKMAPVVWDEQPANPTMAPVVWDQEPPVGAVPSPNDGAGFLTGSWDALKALPGRTVDAYGSRLAAGAQGAQIVAGTAPENLVQVPQAAPVEGPQGFVARGLTGLPDVLGGIGAAATQGGIPGALIGAGTGAVVGTPIPVLGNFASAGAGAVTGAGLGTTAAFGSQAVSDIYGEMTKAGVDPDTARYIGIAAALPYAALEKFQLNVVAKPFMGLMTKAATDVVKDEVGRIGVQNLTPAIVKGILGRAGAYAGGVATETVTEGAQKGVEQLAVSAGQAYDGNADKAAQTLRSVPGQVGQEMVDVLPTMALFGGPGNVAAGVKAGVDARNASLQPPATGTGEVIDTTQIPVEQPVAPEVIPQTEPVVDNAVQTLVDSGVPVEDAVNTVMGELQAAQPTAPTAAPSPEPAQAPPVVENVPPEATQSADTPVERVLDKTTVTRKMWYDALVGMGIDKTLAKKYVKNDFGNATDKPMYELTDLQNLRNAIPKKPTSAPVTPADAIPDRRGVSPAPTDINTPEIASQARRQVAPEPVVSDTQTAQPVADKQVHEYSNTQTPLPEPVANLTKAMGAEIPDTEIYNDPKDPTFGREMDPHITVKYGLHTADPADVAPLLKGVGPIKARLGKVSIFEGKDYDVVKVDVISPALHSLNKKIADGTKVTDTHPEYKPHVTIAYVKNGEGAKYVGDKRFTGQVITLDRVTFSGKDGNKTDFTLGTPNAQPSASPAIPPVAPVMVSQQDVPLDTATTPTDAPANGGRTAADGAEAQGVRQPWEMTAGEYVDSLAREYEGQVEPDLLEGQKKVWADQWLSEIQKTDVDIPMRVWETIPEGYKSVLVQTNNSVKKMLGLERAGNLREVQSYVSDPAKTERDNKEIQSAEFIASATLKQYRQNEKKSRPAMSPKEWKEVSARHRNAVESLAKRGLPVSPAVQAEYPDLFPDAGKMVDAPTVKQDTPTVKDGLKVGHFTSAGNLYTGPYTVWGWKLKDGTIGENNPLDRAHVGKDVFFDGGLADVSLLSEFKDNEGNWHKIHQPEAPPPPVAEAQGVKQPWEMTREEFDKERPPVEGYLYHGSPDGDIESLDPTGNNTRLWIEGRGPYATNEHAIAKSYAEGRTAKGDRKRLAKEKGKVNYIESSAERILNMDLPADVPMWEELLKDLGQEGAVSDFGKTNKDALMEVQIALQEYYGSGDEASDSIEGWLSDSFDATQRTAGRKDGISHTETIFKGDEYYDTKTKETINTLKARVVSPNEVHRRVVEQAISRGETIPPAVQAEYPDLFPDAGKMVDAPTVKDGLKVGEKKPRAKKNAKPSVPEMADSAIEKYGDALSAWKGVEQEQADLHRRGATPIDNYFGLRTELANRAKADGTLNFSATTNPTSPASPQDHATAVRTLGQLNRAAMGPTIRVVRTGKDIPGTATVTSSVQGAYDEANDIVYVASDDLVAKAQAEGKTVQQATRELWFHECGLHRGIAFLFPDAAQRQRVLQAIHDSVGRDALVKELGDAYPQGTLPESAYSALLAEEHLAKVAERTEGQLTPLDKRLMARLIQAVRNVLRRVGIVKAYTEADVRGFVREVMRGVTSGNRNAANGNMRYMTAFHGSPYRGIEQTGFSTDKIGTGEGNQSFGWGLYFADKRSIAEHYRKVLSGPGDGWIYAEIEDAASSSEDTSGPALMEAMKQRAKTYDWKRDKDRVAAQRILELISKLDQSKLSRAERGGIFYDGKPLAFEVDKIAGGQLYEVELAPKEDEYLLWDKPLSEQSETVKKALGKMGVKTVPENDRSLMSGMMNRPDNTFSEMETGGEYYNTLTKGDDSYKEELSRDLHGVGIRGIKYLDGTSRSKGEGDYNYVIFNDKDVSVSKIHYSATAKPGYNVRMDKEYLDAVSRGDMVTAQRMVDEAARKAGYTVKRLYHGTLNGGFTEFDPEKIGSQTDNGWFAKAFWFSDDKGYAAANYAGEYRGKLPDGAEVKEVYLRLNNPKRIGWSGDPTEASRKAASPEVATSKAISEGHDGFIVTKDPRFGEWYEYGVFSPDQIKSSDPVTLEQGGAVVPLSQRFQSGNADIRYSASGKYTPPGPERRNTATQANSDLGRTAANESKWYYTPDETFSHAAMDEHIQKNWTDADFTALRTRLALGTANEALDVRAAKIMSDRDAAEAFKTGRFGRVVETNFNALRAGTIQGRALAARVDDTQTPMERWATAISFGMTDMPKPVRKTLNDKMDQIKAILSANPDLVPEYEAYQAELNAKLSLSATKPIKTAEQVRNEKQARELKRLKKLMNEAFIITRTHSRKAEKVAAELKANGLDLDTIRRGLDGLKANQMVDSKGFPIAVVKQALDANRIVRTRMATWGDIMHEAFIANILSGITTNAINLTSTGLHGAYELTAKRTTEAMVNMFTGKADAAQLGELPAVWAALISPRNLNRAIIHGWNAFQTETPAFAASVMALQSENKSIFDFSDQRSDQHPNQAIPGKIGRFYRLHLRALLGFDEFFKALFGQADVVGQAYRIAKQEGLSGAQMTARIEALSSDLSSTAWGAAMQTASRTVFQEKLSDNLSKFSNMAGGNPILKYIIPFRKTPLNLFKQAIHHLPVVGTAKLGVDMYKGMGEAEMVRRVAEQLIGTAVTLALANAIMGDDDDPWITGTVPYKGTTKGERELAQRIAPPQSIKIGGEWYSYARLDPFSTILSSIADGLATVRALGKGQSAEGAYTDLFAKVSTAIMDKTFLRGLGDMFSAVRDPKEAQTWAIGFGTAFVPWGGFVRGIGRSKDDFVRDSKGDGLAVVSQRGLGMSDAPPKVNLWGEPIKKFSTGSPQTDFVFRMLSPVNVEAPEQRLPRARQLDLMLMRYNLDHPDQIVAPQTPQRYLEQRGKRYDMTDDQYNKFSTMAGEWTLRRLTNMHLNIEKPSERDIERTQKAIEHGRDLAKRRMIIEIKRQAQ